MPAWFYFDRPNNLAFHDLTTSTVPFFNLRSLLGLGHKFCPTPRYSSGCVSDSFLRYHHDYYCKIFYAGKDFQSTDPYDPKMYINSEWTPQDWQIPLPAVRRYNNFKTHIASIFIKQQAPSNLLTHQHLALRQLKLQKEFMVVQCDKNLGPALIEYNVYIQRALQDHLLHQDTYRRLSPDTARHYAIRINDLIASWLHKYHASLLTSERKYIRTTVLKSSNPFPVFYLTMKVHKEPWATRPIVS